MNEVCRNCGGPYHLRFPGDTCPGCMPGPEVAQLRRDRDELLDALEAAHPPEAPGSGCAVCWLIVRVKGR